MYVIRCTLDERAVSVPAKCDGRKLTVFKEKLYDKYSARDEQCNKVIHVYVREQRTIMVCRSDKVRLRRRLA